LAIILILSFPALGFAQEKVSSDRPHWTHKTTFEKDGHIYFTGGFLNGADYPLSIRCANAEALKIATQSISQYIRSVFSMYSQGINTGSVGIELFVVQIGGQYDHSFITRAFGNAHEPKRFVDHQLRIKSAGIIQGLEQNIVRSKWDRDYSGKYTCFVLANYPTNLIKEMRRLSSGTKIIVTALEYRNGKMVFKLSEINGVSVLMTSATINVQKDNRFAKTISFFIWPVPDRSEKKRSVSFTPVQICGNSATIQLAMNSIKKGLTDYILGSRVKHMVMFIGIDEIGRPVQTSVVF
jgi:hypothetical protein